MKNKISILLATYNGEKYIQQLLESIILQIIDLDNTQIIISDDGSSDNTLHIILKYKEDYPDKIMILELRKNGSAKRNFTYLMSNTDADYIFFADQDDIWIDGKIYSMLAKIKFYESVFGEEMPLLIHSDLEVIGEDGRTLASSFWEYQNLKPRWSQHFHLALTQNVVTGCAMVFNRALLDIALPLPDEAVMHDWWLNLVTNDKGRVFYLDEQWVKYRQHSNNEVGAKKFDGRYMTKKIFFGLEDIRKSRLLTSKQAKAFAEQYPESNYVDLAYSFSKLESQTKFRRIVNVIKNKFFKISLARNIGWLFL